MSRVALSVSLCCAVLYWPMWCRGSLQGGTEREERVGGPREEDSHVLLIQLYYQLLVQYR